MDILRIRSFVTVARLGNVTHAAKVLCLTQPVVTGHIRSMEQTLGIELFSRTPSRIELTRAGAELLPGAEKVLADLKALLEHARSLQGEVAGALDFALVDDLEHLRVGRFIQRLRTAFPLMQLKTTHCTAEEVVKRVLASQCDAGFCNIGQLPPELSSLRLQDIDYVVVAPAQLAEKASKAGWRDIAALPWISPPKGSHIRAIQDAMFARQGVTPNLVIECDSLAAIEGMLCAGLGLALMREDTATALAADGKHFIWPHVTLASQLLFVFRTGEAANPAIAAMLPMLEKCWDLPLPG